MNERDTQIITIAGKEYTVKTYATAREASTIQQAYFKGTKVEIVGEQPKISEFNPNVQFDVQLEMVRQMVVAIDGEKDNIVERCEALPVDVFNELASQLDALVTKKKN